MTISKMDLKKVSIITVCYNSGKTIKKTMSSVLNQTYNKNKIEYIVVDGGSKDNTVDIIRSFEPKFKNMRWISEKDSGIYNAMNKGIKLSTGQIIGILNSDDWYEPNTLEHVVDYFSNNAPVHFVHGAMRVVNKNGKVQKVIGERNTIFDFAEKAPFNHPASFALKSVYRSLGLFDERFRTASDYDFMLKVHNDSNIETGYINRVLTNFRATGITSKMIRPPVGQINKILKKNNYNYIFRTTGIFIRWSKVLIKTIETMFGLDSLLNNVRYLIPYHKLLDNN